jgi:toxin YoeB
MRENAQVVTSRPTWTLVYTKQAQKDAKKLAGAGLKPKAETLLAVLESDPFQKPPPYEKLVGDLAVAYSRRINVKHRLVFQVVSKTKVVKVIRMWTHYE